MTPVLLPAAEVDAASVWRRVRRHTLAPLFLVALFCQLDRAGLSYAAMGMAEDLSFFTRTVQGLGSGLFFIGYLLQIPANLACIALGPRRWLPVILVAWGAVAMCFAAVRTTASFLVLRLLLGAAEAGAYPAIMFSLSLFYPPRNLGMAYTAVATATAAAGLLGGPIAAGIMSMDGVAGLEGWQWLFLLEGIPPLLLAAVLPLWLPTNPLSARFLSPAEQQWLWREVNGHQGDVELTAAGGTGSGSPGASSTPLASPTGAAAGSAARLGPDAVPPAHAEAGGATEQAGSADVEHAELLGPHKRDGGEPSAGSGGGGSSGLRGAMRRGLTDRRVWMLAAVMLLVDVNLNAIHFWMPTLVKAALQGQLQSDSGSSGHAAPASLAPAPALPNDDDDEGGTAALLVHASLLSALPFCGAAVCMVANAWHARRADERRLHTALPMLCAAVAWAALPPAAAVGPGPAIAALTVAASGIWATHGPLFSWPSAFLDKKAAAMGFALVKTGGAVGAFAGPFAIGLMADLLHGYTGAMLMLAGVAAAAAGLVCVFDDRHP